MGTTNNPYVTAQLLAADAELQDDPWRVLIVGQLGTDATGTAGKYYSDIQNYTNDQLSDLFGTEGELINRILRCRRIANGLFSIGVIALTAASGTAATADLVFAGTATEDGTITVKPIDYENFEFTLDVTEDETAATLAAAVQTELDALDYFPATTSLSTATLTLTANDVGTLPNKWAVEITGLPAGLTLNSNTGTDRVQFSDGATDPDNSGIFDVVEEVRFQAISWPWEDDYSEVQDFLEDRNTIDNNFLQGVAFIGLDATESGVSSAVSTLNSQNLVFMGNNLYNSVNAIITPPDWMVAEFLAIEGLRMTDDASVADYVTVSSANDVVGGPSLASLAYYNTPMDKTAVTDPTYLFDQDEQTNVIDYGYTLVGVNKNKTSMIMGQVVTTYKYDDNGDDNTSFKYLNYVRTGFKALEYFFNVMKSEYGQFRLTEGDLVQNHAITNADQIQGRLEALYSTLSGEGYVLVQAGNTAETYFHDNLSVTTDLATGKVTISGKLPIVTQFRKAVMTFQLSFDIG